MLNNNPEIDEDGNKVWSNEKGEWHRIDGPAIEYKNGSKVWLQNGKNHRIDGPAVEYANGNKEWYQNGKYHREDGPAIELRDGSKFWCQNGNRHRLDGPAVEHANGDKFWYQNDKLHRIDGPAIEYASGKKYWYIENMQYTEEEYNKKIKEMKIQNPEIDKDGNKRWYNEKRELHRINGPAVESVDGSKFWFQNGKYHRIDGPACEYASGDKCWFIEGEGYAKKEFNKKISEMSPVIDNNKTKRWYNEEGRLHRDNGPAIEWNHGTKDWYQNGKLHREDGPAVIWSNNTKEWWVNDKYHRLDGPAIEWANGSKSWYIEGVNYTEEEFNKKIGKKVENTMKEIIKDRFEQAAYRSASRQMVNGISKAIMIAAEKKGMDSFTTAAVGKFFETELGTALIGAMLGIGIPYIPKINKDKRALKLAEEFQIESISTVTDTLLTEVMTYVLPVVTDALKALPSRVEEDNNEEETVATVNSSASLAKD